MTIESQHLEALRRFGYTMEEAEFLYLVAVHSGYFTRRQFLHFAGIERGQRSQDFLNKLVSDGYATAHTYRMGARVYHVFARRIFNAIGHENLRTRRRHQLDYIKTRLMALDFVLAHPEYHYLETEEDKVPFFEDRLRIERCLLPSRTYCSRVSEKTTTRYFVDRFPLYIKDTNPPEVAFTYLDPGFASASGFRTHLQAYSGLFRALAGFNFSYVSVSENAFPSAQWEFSRIVVGGGSNLTKDALLRYFALRKTWEAGGRVPAADVVFLNGARREFRGESVESAYRNWCEGHSEESDLASLTGSSKRAVQGTLCMVMGGESLSVFHRQNRETVLGDEGEAGSPTCSASGSGL